MKLKDIIDRNPNERQAIERLEAWLEGKPLKGKVFPFERMYEIVQPSSMTALARILYELVQYGILKETVSVESSNGGGIASFDSVTDVPDVIHDLRTDTEMRVRPENIRVLYRVASDR